MLWLNFLLRGWIHSQYIWPKTLILGSLLLNSSMAASWIYDIISDKVVGLTRTVVRGTNLFVNSKKENEIWFLYRVRFHDSVMLIIPLHSVSREQINEQSAENKLQQMFYVLYYEIILYQALQWFLMDISSGKAKKDVQWEENEAFCQKQKQRMNHTSLNILAIPFHE